MKTVIIHVVRALVFVGLLAPVGSLFAADGTWHFREGVGTSPMNAANWSDEDNWEGGVVPDGASDKADLSAAADLYIRVDTAVKLEGFKGGTSGHLVNLIGDGSLSVPLRNYPTGYSGQYVRFYIHLISTSTSYNSYYAGGNCEYCGPTTLPGFDTNDGAFNFRFDRFASAAGEHRMESPFVAFLKYYSSVRIYGPQSLAEDVTSRWSLSVGSVYATPVVTTDHALPVGTLVTGGGFPAGTFLKRTFADGTIELSEAAQQPGEQSLTFAAFTPDLTVKVSSISSQADSQAFVSVNKYRAADSLRVEVGVYNGNSKWLHFGQDGNYEPGEIVLKDATDPTIKASLLNYGRVEFAGGEELEAGIPNGVLAITGSGTKEGTVIVTNGIMATVGTLQGFDGTLRKEGAGTLRIKAVDGSVTGSFVVQEGSVTVEAMKDGTMATLGNLDVASGATYKLALGGLKITGTLTTADGAHVAGPGVLVLPRGVDSASLAIDDNVTVIVGDYDFASIGYSRTAAAPATSPLDDGLPAPAIWLDVSRENTLVTNAGTTNPNLERWNDVRDGAKVSGNEYPYATAMGATSGAYPSVITNKEGRAVRVSTPNVYNTTTTAWKTMKYSTTVPRIRAIFKAQTGAGQFVGDSRGFWWREDFYYSSKFCYRIDSASSPITSPYELYVNGETRLASLGMPYGGGASADAAKRDLMVIDMHFADDGNVPTAGYIGFSGSINAARNGGDQVCEILYYTVELSKEQREKIRGYLMKKWMNGSEAGTDYKSVDACVHENLSIAGGETGIPVAEGREMVVEKVDVATDGKLAKTGAGTLYVNDLAVAGDVRVAAGTLNVKSLKLSRETVPGTPYLHVDASDVSTMDFVADSTTEVRAWHDVRGAGFPVANVVNDVAGKYPKIEADACNGLSVISYGSALYGSDNISDCTGFTFPTVDNLYSVYRVFGGNGGGLIAGYVGKENGAAGIYDNKDIHSISRLAGGYTTGTAWWDKMKVKDSPADGTALYNMTQTGSSYGPDSPGSSRFRMDGVSCDPSTTKRDFGSYQTMVYSGRDHIVSDALGCDYGSQVTTKYRGGGQKTGEHILYTNTLNRTSMLAVEAYLRKKWFNVDTPSYRPASVRTLTVDAGATLTLDGGAPITAEKLAVAGAINGSVELAEGGEFDIVVADDGTIAPLPADGFAVSGGTVRLTGATRLLRNGVDYVLADGVSGSGEWQVVDAGDCAKVREYSVKVVGTRLVLAIVPKGLLLLVR